MKKGLGFVWPLFILAAVMAFMIVLKPVQTVSEEEAYMIETIQNQLDQQQEHLQRIPGVSLPVQDHGGSLPVQDVE